MKRSADKSRQTRSHAVAVKSMTLSADERLIEAARRRAQAEHTTLDVAFRRWLADSTQAEQQLQRLDEVMAGLQGRLQVGHPIGRDERSELGTWLAGSCRSTTP